MRRVKRAASCLPAVACLILAACSVPLGGQAGTTGVTVFEGARLITGDGSAPIEDSAFLVENSRFTRVGRRGQLQVPAGAVRVDLTGKTVMPAKVDLHGHIGYQHVWDGTMAKEYFTRENLIDHLQLLAYYGISATVGIGDLVDRSDLHGGRTNWGDVPLRVRNEVIPGAALFRTAGAGIAWPGSGANGHPSRTDVPYPVTTVEEARQATRDYVRMKPEFVKIWVDDRDGRTKKLTPSMYLAIIEEAHKANVPVAAHNITLADAKLMMKAGVEGWLHPPVRGGELPDDEFLAMIRERIARNDRPNLWFNPQAGTAAASREDWNDPLLRETISPEQIEAQVGEQLRNITPESTARARQRLKEMGATSALKLRAAGMKIVLGGDTGQSRFFIGWSQQLEFENWVWMGLTPSEAIVAATRDSAAAGHFNAGMVAVGKNADFIVLDANPLENIANSRRINRVYLRGQEVDRAGMRARWQAKWKAAPRVVAQGRSATPRGVPSFRVDPTWPTIPNNWQFGQVASVSVDAQDHVWVLQRPGTLGAEEKARAAPPVLEFDAAGTLVQAWGGPGQGYEWPTSEHGVYVDPSGFVWIGGNGAKDHQILKFTRAGKFVMQIGRAGQSTGNADTRNLNQPADTFVYAKTNELFVADGYGNRRVIVFDATSGAFKRMWGAFGNAPTDAPPNPALPDADEKGAPQFVQPVHAARVSSDGLVYVSDRGGKRVQVFRLDGTYVSQVFIGRECKAPDCSNGTTAASTAFSADPEQRFLYVGNRSQARVMVLDRRTLETLYTFGEWGSAPGQFGTLHHMASDSKGNLYVTEVTPLKPQNRRVQKFSFTGLSSPPAK